jgi:hypothetical protein
MCNTGIALLRKLHAGLLLLAGGPVAFTDEDGDAYEGLTEAFIDEDGGMAGLVVTNGGSSAFLALFEVEGGPGRAAVIHQDDPDGPKEVFLPEALDFARKRCVACLVEVDGWTVPQAARRFRAHAVERGRGPVRTCPKPARGGGVKPRRRRG